MTKTLRRPSVSFSFDKSHDNVFSQIGRQCKRLNPPAYGKISLPYLPYYESSCRVNCIDTHYLVGPDTDTCTVDEEDTMKWKNRNECRGNCF